MKMTRKILRASKAPAKRGLSATVLIASLWLLAPTGTDLGTELEAIYSKPAQHCVHKVAEHCSSSTPDPCLPVEVAANELREPVLRSKTFVHLTALECLSI